MKHLALVLATLLIGHFSHATTTKKAAKQSKKTVLVDKSESGGTPEAGVKKAARGEGEDNLPYSKKEMDEENDPAKIPPTPEDNQAE